MPVCALKKMEMGVGQKNAHFVEEVNLIEVSDLNKWLAEKIMNIVVCVVLAI